MNLLKRALSKIKNLVGDSKKENEKTDADINAPKFTDGAVKGAEMPRGTNVMSVMQKQISAMTANKINKRRRLNKIGHETRRKNRV